MPSAHNLISARFQVLVPSRKLKTKVSVHDTGFIFLLVLIKSWDLWFYCSLSHQLQFRHYRLRDQLQPFAHCIPRSRCDNTQADAVCKAQALPPGKVPLQDEQQRRHHGDVQRHHIFTFLVALVRSSIRCLPVTFWNSS